MDIRAGRISDEEYQNGENGLGNLWEGRAGETKNPGPWEE
jgi:hypothetical protein